MYMYICVCAYAYVYIRLTCLFSFRPTRAQTPPHQHLQRRSPSESRGYARLG